MPIARALWRYWRHHPLQVVLTLLGIALGVAVFTGIRLANAGAMASFREGIAVTAGAATHRVYAPGAGGVPEAIVAPLAALPAVRALMPLMEATARVERPDQPPVRVLGVDLVTAIDLLGVVPDAVGASGDGSGAPMDWARLEQFMTLPGAALASAELLPAPATFGREPEGEGVGALALRVDGRRIVPHIVSAFVPPEGRAAGFRRTLLVDPATFQEWFGGIGRLEGILLVLRPGGEAAVAERLHAGLRVEPIGRQSERARTIVAAFQTNLEALGLFTLLVAVFLIFNATSFAVVQRRRLVGVLRCIGARSGAIATALLAEAALAGLAGSLLGVAAGGWLAEFMLRGTRETVFDVFLGTRATGGAALPWTLGSGQDLLLGLLLGMAGALAGTVWPAWEAARVSPLDALRGASPAAPRPPRWPVGAGLALLAVGGMLALPAHGPLVLALLAATLLALGSALLTPAVLAATGRAAGWALERVRAPVLRLGARNAARGSGRSGVAAATLMIALALWLAIAITVGSFRQTLVVWMDQVVRAEVYLSATGDGQAGGLPPALLTALREAPWVRDMSVLRRRVIEVAERPVRLMGIDVDVFTRYAQLPMRHADPAAAYAAAQAGGALVSESLAYPLRLRAGDTLMLPTPAGERVVPIAAIVQNYAFPSGAIYLHRETYRELYGEEPPLSAGIWLQPGVGFDQAATRIAGLPGGGRVRVEPSGALRAEAMRVLERTFAITETMRGVAATVAFVAVVSALMALVSERRRVLGALRATGMSVRALAGAILVEAGLLATVAAALAWGVGLLMALVLVFVVNRRAFGWTLQFEPQAGPYLGLLAVALGAAALGALLPVLATARLSVLAAIREE